MVTAGVGNRGAEEWSQGREISRDTGGKKSHFEIITGLSLAKAKYIFGEQALRIPHFLSSSATADFGEKPLFPISLFCLVIETQIKGEAAPPMVWSMMARDLGASGEAQSMQGSQKASNNQVLALCNGSSRKGAGLQAASLSLL